METIPRVVPKGLSRFIVGLFFLGIGSLMDAQPITSPLVWKDLEWSVSDGQPLGIQTAGQISSRAENVELDSDGALHLKLSSADAAFTGAEVLSTQALGYGTYTWDLEGPVDVLEPQVVFGLIFDGPSSGLGANGENTILIEFTRWSSEVPGNNLSFTVFPAQGFGDPSLYPSHEYTFSLDLKGLNKIRISLIWTPAKVTVKLLNTKNKVIQEESFVPEFPEEAIPRVALPVGFRLWSYRIPPSEPVDLIIRNFSFQPAP